MSPQLSQRNRQIAIRTSFEEDKLLLRAVSGRQSLSRLFRFDLDLLSEDPSIPFEDAVGQSVSVHVELEDGQDWHWNGFLTQFSQTGQFQKLTKYRAVMAPWLWFLTRNKDCRIFQNKTAPEIIEDVFRRNGFSQFDLRLYGEFPKREYCVQYRESDFTFVSRLMEEEGVYYFFAHEQGKHTLVLANQPAAHQPCPVNPLKWHDGTSGSSYYGNLITRWETTQHVRTGEISLIDYNPQRPTPGLAVTRASEKPWRIHDYPGVYRTRGEGERIAKIRLQEQASREMVSLGATTCSKLAPGQTIEMDGYYRPDLDGKYLVTRVIHPRIEADDYRSHGDDVREPYINDFACIPAERTYRPRRVTKRPFVRGCQTAIVVGPETEEIHTDKHGRIKVRFHWDVEDGKRDEDRSCWIRVAQSSAGKGWGFFSLPRIGHEVVVNFLEGDPDRPLVTASVYNRDSPPPYDSGGRREMMGFRSNSSKGGGGYNEIVISDLKGSELIRMHSQKDMQTTVLNDRQATVVNNDTDLVKNNRNVHVIKDLQSKVDGKLSNTVQGDVVEKYDSNHAETVTAERLLKAKRIIIEADQEICIKVGGNHVTISANGVYVDGTMVDLNCGHAALNTTLSNLTPTPPQDPS